MSGKNIKVGILTFHRAYNYGAILQAYALQKVIRRLGIRCEVIDYWNVEKKRNHALFRIDFQMGISRNLSKLIKDIYRTWKNKNFNQFMHNVSMLSEIKYSTLEELREMDVHEGYNVYVVGSDQVWNSSIVGELSDVYLQIIMIRNVHIQPALEALNLMLKCNRGMQMN